MSEVERVLDTSNIQLRIPTKTIQFCDVLFRVLVGIDQRRDHVDGMGTPARRDDVVTDLSQLETLRTVPFVPGTVV